MSAVTVTASVDTFFSPPDYSDSVDVYLGNFLNPGDILDVTLNDDENWLTGSANYSVALDSTFGVTNGVPFTVPGSASPGTVDMVTINAVSQSNNSQSQTDTFYILVYQPVMTTIRVFPDTAIISPGDSIQFYSVGYDQYNRSIIFSPQWDATGGSINSEGWYFAGTQTGSFEVTATDPVSQVQGHASVIISIIAGIKEELAKLPTEYELYQNYPNPFNPTTTIRYAVPFTSNVTITIYNILGEQVERLIGEIKSPGIYETKWNASMLSSGVYIYVIRAESESGNKNFMQAKKLILLK